MQHALILAGGSGTRLWPYSTAGLPKQVVPLLRGQSLLELAVARAAAVVDPSRIWLGTGTALAEAVSRVPGLAGVSVVLEPSGKDTLPALVLAMATIAASDPDAVVAVLTADHVIEPLATFAGALQTAFAVAQEHHEALVTFGVVPDHPATGFGYLELDGPFAQGALRVRRFAEKPQPARAAQLVESGALWNSGMFVWQAGTFLRAVAEFAPDTLDRVQRFRDGDAGAWESLVKTSVDYAVMEPASTSPHFRVVAVPLAAEWLDVGSWPQYGDAVGRDDRGNALGAASTVLLDSSDCVVASSDSGHLVALVGCEGLVVVHTPTATLVMPAAAAQSVKDLHALVATGFPPLA